MSKGQAEACAWQWQPEQKTQIDGADQVSGSIWCSFVVCFEMAGLHFGLKVDST